MIRFAIALPACCLALSGWSPARAQQDATTRADSGAIAGQLVAEGTQSPIPRGVVAVVGTQRTTTTDSAGLFRFTGLMPGEITLEARAPGYVATSWQVSLKPRQVFMQVVQMKLLTYELPGVTVQGRQPLSERRFVDFERRRQSGIGAFVTQEDIEQSGVTQLIDALIRVRGVTQVCISNDCVAKMIRSPPGCYPQYFIDGQESTPYFARHTPPRDIRGIEIYRGSSEIPAEFTGSNSACGVIAIWTKSAP